MKTNFKEFLPLQFVKIIFQQRKITKIKIYIRRYKSFNINIDKKLNIFRINYDLYNSSFRESLIL